MRTGRARSSLPFRRASTLFQTGARSASERQPDSTPQPRNRNPMLLLRSIFFTILQPGTVTILIPYWLVSSRGVGVSRSQALRYSGLPLILIGAAGLLWCIWNFFSAGRGTISPIDPPKHLVVRGLYKYVRNPMYVAVVTILLGEAILFMSWPVLIEAGIFFLLATLFAVLYEEPTLRRKFGDSYERYTQTVGRWIPRCRPLPK